MSSHVQPAHLCWTVTAPTSIQVLVTRTEVAPSIQAARPVVAHAIGIHHTRLTAALVSVHYKAAASAWDLQHIANASCQLHQQKRHAESTTVIWWAGDGSKQQLRWAPDCERMHFDTCLCRCNDVICRDGNRRGTGDGASVKCRTAGELAQRCVPCKCCPVP